MIPTRETPYGSRLASIDCLRGLAVLAVLVHHVLRMSFPEKSLFWIQEWVNTADLGVRGVALFFVISGFCIHMPWARRKAEGADTHVGFLHFWKRRLWRLYPPYFVALTGGMILMLLLASIGKYGAVTPDYYPGYRFQVGVDYLLHLTMLHGFVPLYDGAGTNPPFWTLAREEYLYLLYFGLLFCRTRSSAWTSTLAALVAGIGFRLAMGALMGEHATGWSLVTTSAIVLWIQWALGMLAVEGALGLVRLPAWTRQLLLVPAWIAVAAYVDVHAPLLSPLCWGLAFFTLINWAVTTELARRWPARGAEWLRRTGVISYSIYLTHWPSVWLAVALMHLVLGDRTLTPSKLGYAAQLAYILVVGYGTGWLYFQLVERRFLNTREAAAPAVAVAAL